MNLIKKSFKQPFSEIKELTKAAVNHDWEKFVKIQEKLRIERGDEFFDNYLTSLAYYRIKDYEKATLFGQKALNEGRANFDLFKLLTNIFYSQKNHIEAVQYAEQAVQNSTLSLTKILITKALNSLKLISFIPVFGKFVIRLDDEVQASIKHRDNWIDWAKNYIRWYSKNKEKFGSKIS